MTITGFFIGGNFTVGAIQAKIYARITVKLPSYCDFYCKRHFYSNYDISKE